MHYSWRQISDQSGISRILGIRELFGDTEITQLLHLTIAESLN